MKCNTCGHKVPMLFEDGACSECQIPTKKPFRDGPPPEPKKEVSKTEIDGSEQC